MPRHLQLLRDLIVVDVEPGVAMVGLIHIPDITKSTRNQTFQHASVIAVGPKAEVSVGDRVLVSEYFGDVLPDEWAPWRIGRARDIVGIVK